MSDSVSARDVTELPASAVVYSFCTLVTKAAEYQAMIEAFAAKGFTCADCEFLFIDNSRENRLDAYAGCNRFLQEARGRYVILCHQDILPIEDDRGRLDRLLEELTQFDPDWGVCGNAGVDASDVAAMRISDPHGMNQAVGRFPARVMSLDENFIIARRDANLALSHDLSGFHRYGSDICLIADVLGWNAYVIDFHLRHKSGGKVDERFFADGLNLQQKYARAFRSRWQYVLDRDRPIFISGLRVETVIAQTLRRLRLFGERKTRWLGRIFGARGQRS